MSGKSAKYERNVRKNGRKVSQNERKVFSHLSHAVKLLMRHGRCVVILHETAELCLHLQAAHKPKDTTVLDTGEATRRYQPEYWI